MTTVGILHPGAMGAAVAGELAAAGHDVRWASAGRSAASAERARGLADAGTVDALVDGCELILSICPPYAALDVARAVDGFRGTYVDANAIAPATARAVAGVVEASGATYVDGGIIGPPPAGGRTTRLYLSGAEAPGVAGLFAGTAVDARVVAGDVTAASALKMTYAAWTKGTGAMLLAIRETARTLGVEDALLAEWDESQPELAERWREAAASAAAKGWRWTGEMREIARTFGDAGLPPGFHEAAAEVYARDTFRE